MLLFLACSSRLSFAVCNESKDAKADNVKMVVEGDGMVAAPTPLLSLPL